MTKPDGEKQHDRSKSAAEDKPDNVKDRAKNDRLDDRPNDAPDNTKNDATDAFDDKVLEFLVCPVTKTPLRYDREAQELISDKAGLAYPIKDGIAIMLIDQARPISPNTSTRPSSKSSAE